MKPKATATTTKAATVPAQAPNNPANPAPATEKQALAGQANLANGIVFARPKSEKAKSDRPFCDHVYENGPKKGQRCSLRVQEGFSQCTNHVQAESKLTAEEAQALLALVGGLDEAQQIRLLTRSIGWFKVKQLVGGKPEGDVLLNELVG